MKQTYWPNILLLVAQVIWGSTFFITKHTQDFIGPVSLLAYRFILGALIMGGFIYLVQRKPLFTNFWQGLMLGLILSAAYIAQSVGLIYISASNSGFITGLFIIFVPLFSFVFFKIVPSQKHLIALAIALVGLWILTGGVKEMSKGDILTLGTAAAIATHILYANKLVKDQVDPYVLNFQQLLTIGISCSLLGLIFKQSFSIANSTVVWAILYLSVGASLLALLIQNWAQKYLSPLRVSMIFTTEAVFASIFAWTLGNETMVPVKALGGGLIFLAMIITELPLEKWVRDLKLRGLQASDNAKD